MYLKCHCAYDLAVIKHKKLETGVTLITLTCYCIISDLKKDLKPATREQKCPENWTTHLFYCRKNIRFTDIFLMTMYKKKIILRINLGRHVPSLT